MILILGGAWQGKLTWAASHGMVGPMFDLKDGWPEAPVRCCRHLEALTRAASDRGETAQQVPHRFAGMHAPHEVIGLEHPPHGHGQRQRDAHGQPFGNGHHDDRHRNHEDVQHVLRDGQPVALEQPAREDEQVLALEPFELRAAAYPLVDRILRHVTGRMSVRWWQPR